MLFGIVYFFYYLFEKKLEQDNLKEKETFVRNKFNDIEEVSKDFKGQTLFEKVEEGVVYFANPLRSKTDVEDKDFKSLNL